MEDLEELVNYKEITQPILKPKKKITHTDCEINNLIRKYNGYLKDFQKKHDYNDELINMLTLIQISLNELYGKKINDIFYQVMDKNRIYLEEGHTYELCQKYGLEETNPYVTGFYTMDKPKNLFTKKTKIIDQKIFIGDTMFNQKLPKIDILETLIHELRHAITSVKETNFYINKNLFYSRSGLSEFFYKKGEEDAYVYGSMIDEVFNVYFTDILMNNILNYKKNNIDRNDFKKYLYTLKNYSTNKVYESTAYDLEKLICKPLFLNKDIVQSANYAAITGDINAFANNFENYNYYINLLDCLSYDFDEYYYLDNEDQNKVKEMILEFKNQTLKNAKYYKN
jgi:hypothetical protein